MKSKTVYSAIPKYPASVRDLSLVCGKDTACGEVTDIIRASCKSALEKVEFFDLFTGGGLSESGRKSLSFKLTFRKHDGTLTDEEVDKSVKKILVKLEEKNITLRS
jgi:phenylalanyl-tRNA synthetase beta chain